MPKIPRQPGMRGRYAMWAVVVLTWCMLPVLAHAQGSIFGVVQNSNLSNPAVGDLYWVGFLDNTDEEIRIESNTGAGFDGLNWFDDFQNYTTEVAGNPYDYYFINVTNGEAFHLGKTIPSNSFQQEDVILAAATFPARPSGLLTRVASESNINVSWTYQSGVTYHVYRRVTGNNGVFRRIDNPAGSLANPGVADSFFVDATSDGLNNYTYIIIGEDVSGNYSAHSVEVTADATLPIAPAVFAVDPDSGSATGTPAVTVTGTNFDIGGANVTFDGNAASNVTVLSPFEITCNVPTGTPGFVDVVVTNLSSGMSSSPLVGGFRYLGNANPVLASIGAQSVDEGQNLNFGISATDTDGDSIILSAENVPVNATFTDNFDGTGSFDFNPDFTQSGVYNVRLIASDGSLADTEIVAVTVNQIGLAPILATIGAQSVDEGQNLNLGLTASDADGDSLIFSAETVPTNATFTDNFDNTGTFDFNPDFTQAGVYNVRFIVSDGVLADSEIVAITVNDVNRAPVMIAAAAQSVDEGLNLNFGVSATDPDGDSVILVAENVPANATFSDNFDGTGTFDFNPDFTQAGVYNVRFIATDGVLNDTAMVAITVNGTNLVPVLAAIGAQSVDENQNLNFGVSASDSDGDSLILSAVNVPANGSFVDNFNGTGTFDFNPDVTQAGVYNVSFIASDGILADTEIVAITVNQVNQAPVLASIGAQFVSEGQNLNFAASATDIDGDSLILSAENLPANASFADNFDGSGTFDFNPDFTQSGVYNVRFIASDGTLADTEIVAVTVNDAGNQRPVLASIGAQAVTENLNLNFGIAATDTDLDSLILSAVNVPANASFADNFDGTGTFNFDPDFTQAGIYNVTFIASDGALADTEIVAITVNDAGNQRPVLAAIGSQVVSEGLNLNVGVSASDADLDSLILTAEDLPANASFADNFDGTGTLDFNPDFTQAGVYNIRFIASDGSLADTEIVAVTVNDAGNQKPVLAAIGSQVVSEGLNLNFGVSATDADLDSLVLTAEDLPANATFADNFDGSGTFDFNPDFTQSGVYNVRFIVSDGVLADTEIVAVTVNDAGNQAPVLATIGAQSVAEGLNLNVGVSATDADLDSLILTAENIPANATFTDNFDGSGVFDFNPDFTQAGVYNVRFIVSDGVLADTEIVAVTVNDGGNQRPVLAAIGAQAVNEAQNLNFGVSATDVDLDSLILSAVNLPTNATFTDNFDGTGTFDFNPDFTQAGIYNVSIIASDGVLADTEIVAITVNDVNRVPVLALIGTLEVDEGLNLNTTASGSDPDLDSLILTAEDLPANATFTDNFDGTGTLDFNPDFAQAGVYNVRIFVSDGVLADTEIVAIVVSDVNLAPALSTIGAKNVLEGANLNFGVSATDFDGDSLILSAENVPVRATFQDNFDGTGVFDFDPDYTQAGVYNVTFVVSDGALADTEIVAITVTSAGNQRPILNAIGSKVVIEGTNLNFLISASDADSTIPVLSALSVPANATFTNHLDGTGTFDFNPTFVQAGVYNVIFIASDGALADSEFVQITVLESGNQRPVLNTIGPQTVDEGQTLALHITAFDADGNPLTLVAQNRPANSTFVDSTGGVGGFVFNPNFTQAGLYNVRFIASDGALADTEIVAITVLHVSLPPVLAAIGPQSVDEGQNLNVIVTGSDFDFDSLILSAENLPANATFADNFNNTGTFDFNPDFTQSGIYNVRFIVSDGALADTEMVAITVNHTNVAPVLNAIGPQGVAEGANLNFAVSTSDFDGDNLILSAVNVPANATFIDNLDNTGVFDFNPDFTQAGVYNVTFISSDGALADTEIVAITVGDAGNQSPVLDPIGPQAVTEGQNLNLAITGSDPDGDSVILSAVNLPANATFTDNFDGSGVFDFTPDFVQAGVYNVTFISSDGVLADTEIVAITVNEAGNQIPILATIGAQLVNEGENLNVGIVGTDPDGDSLILSAANLPANATFADNFDGTGTLDFNPDFAQAGVYNITFVASDGALADTEIVAITVNDAGNQRPVLATIGGQAVDEGQNLNFGIAATDPDLDSIILSAVDVPANATFTDNFDGTGTFDFNPDFTQAGVFSVTFISSDGALADTEVVAITVNQINLGPALAAIGSQLVDEGLNLNFAVSAIDPDLDSIVLSAVNVPANATFLDNFDGSGTFDFNPDFTQAGIYPVTFIASDGALADTEIVTITVNDGGNQRPILAPIGAQVVDEGQNLNLGISGTDPDADSVILSAVNVPANAIFTDNFDGTGIFDFNPSFFQAGSYDVTFISSDGVLADTEIVAITVNNVNQLPVLDPIGPLSVLEGDSLSLLITASDADSLIPSITAESLPAGAVFADSANGTAGLVFAPQFDQAGVYQILFIASDGVDADSESVTLTVLEAGNQSPTLALIGPLVVQEGDTLEVRIAATDVDGDSLTMSAVDLPPNATFADSLNNAAGFVFPTNFNDGGSAYQVTFIASDGALADTEIVLISIVEVGNLPPVFDADSARFVNEGDTLIILVHAVDPEGGTLLLGTLAPHENGVFVDSGNGYGTYTYTPDFHQAGQDTIRILAVDDGSPIATNTLVIPITTVETNLAPDMPIISDQTVLAGDSIKVRVVATDSTAPLGNILYMTALNLPANATYQDSGSGIGKFKFKPTFAQIGPHVVTFIATDNGTPALAKTQQVTFTVVSQNRPPVLQAIGPKQILEGDTLQFNIYATDPDGTTPFFSVTQLPDGAALVDSGNGVATFTWIPAFFQSGLYQVKFWASDGLLTDNEQILIQVTEAGNQPPVLVPIGPMSIVEKSTLTAVIGAFDPDLDVPSLTIDTLIENATFVDSGNGYGVFTITPQFWQDSTYTLLFTTSDGELADSEYVTLTIQDVGNQLPFFSDYDTTISISEGLLQPSFRFVAASDSDLTVPSLLARPLPAWASFADSGDGTGAFEFLPGYADSGHYQIYAIAVDAEYPADMDSVLIELIVVDANRAPTIDSTSWGALGFTSLQPGETRTVWLRGVDPDGPFPKMEVDSGLVANMTFTDSLNGIATLQFSPTFAQETKTFKVRFIARDQVVDSLISETKIFQFTVAQRQLPPVLNPIGPRTVVEGDVLSFVAVATDSNVIFGPPKVRVYGAPTENLVLDSTSVAGQLGFVFSPSFTQSGVYSMLFEARDPSNLIDTERVAITVVEAGNKLPVWMSAFRPETDTMLIGAFATDSINMWAADPDNEILTLSAVGTPPGGSFIVRSDTSAAFYFTPPTGLDGNVYTVRFIVSDGIAADTAMVHYHVLGYTRGDLTADGQIDALDLGYLIDYLFAGGPEALPVAEAGNVDGNGDIDALDLGYLIDYLFAGGSPPPP